MKRKFAFIFVCQAGGLETKGLLLAASLKRHLRCDFRLIAAVPAPPEKWGTLSQESTQFLGQLGVRIVSITNDIDPDYPIGNKVSCLRVKTDADRLVFLDSDIVLTRPFDDETRFALPFAAKPADLPNVKDLRQWKRAYGAAKVKLPAGRVATTLYGQLVPPYFNAGMIVVDPRAGIGDAWLDCCKRIDAKWGIRLKRPHLDQIALPVAVAKLGLAYDCLDERFNYPAHLKAIDDARPPIFAHYHDPQVLRREPMLRELVRDLCCEHLLLGDRLRNDPAYAPMLVLPSIAVVETSATPATIPPAPFIHPAPNPASKPPELLITGIPRSGTSYVANLLHRFENCVVLNEPDEVSRPLRKEVVPFGIGTFSLNVRCDVLEGRPIRNKLRDGKVTDETMDANDLTEYRPPVTRADFVLGLKNPLGFVSRLDALRHAMPHARVVACIRNPWDTIASWKTTFAHLKTADVSEMTHGGLRDPFLPPRHRAALLEVSKLKSPAWRRAAWWRYLAQLILDAGPNVMLVQYTDAVSDPLAVVNRIFEGFEPGVAHEPIRPSTVRDAKRSVLDEEDLQSIHSLCGETAAALGVAEGWGKDYAQRCGEVPAEPTADAGGGAALLAPEPKLAPSSRQ